LCNPPNLVRLREIQSQDLPKLFEFQLEPEGNERALTHPRNSQEFDEHWYKILRDPSVTIRAIMVDGTLAGCISCFPCEKQNHVGYWLGKTHWGKGVASDALLAFLDEVTDRPLYARVAASNASSIRVLQKGGFQEVCREWTPGSERFVACEEVVFKLP